MNYSMINVFIDQKIMMDPFMFHIDWWNNWQSSNEIVMEEFMDEKEVLLLIEIQMIQHLER